MPYVLSCTSYNAETQVCEGELWISQPGLLPPLPAAEGLLIAGSMITVCAIAWSLKAIRRQIWKGA